MMVTQVPHVAKLDDLSPSWGTALIAALGEVNGIPTAGPVALTLTSGWGNWGGGWAEAQVSKWGKLVACAGLIKNNTGATVSALYTLGTIPVGYRPRAVGSAAPLGGLVLTVQFVSDLTAQRVDFMDTGTIRLTNGSIANAGYVALSGCWITD